MKLHPSHCLNNLPGRPRKNSRSRVQALINLGCFSFFCFCLFFFLFFLVFVCFRFFCPFVSQTHLGTFNPTFIRSDGVFPVSSSPDAFVASSPIPGVPRSNASLEPSRRRPFHALNSASQSDPAKVTVQERGNASPAMNEALPGTITKNGFVSQQARHSIRVNSESLSNEIDESDLQYAKHDEPRI
jgi:hypothetical protein